jgi:hypothetical protein
MYKTSYFRYFLCVLVFLAYYDIESIYFHLEERKLDATHCKCFYLQYYYLV